MKNALLIMFIALGLFLTDCNKNKIPDNINFKQEMRDFVQNISIYAKLRDTNFLVIPQNGEQLVSENGEPDGNPTQDYLNSIDGQGREDLFYGYNDDDEATPNEEIDYMMSFLNISKQNGVQILVTDYCFTSAKMDNSYTLNHNAGFISFAAPERELNVIPGYPTTPFDVNTNDINSLNDAKNFLYLINPDYYTSKQAFINAVSQTNFDIIIMDLFFNDVEFTTAEVESLKTKLNGGKRPVISYMSIGEAEDYRYYWKNEWNKNEPDWLYKENPDWEGNYKVFYWERAWQDIIFGNENSYLQKILNAGFDGVYLDIIDAFEYYEEN